MAKDSKSEERRDAILKKMLKTPHKPHQPLEKKQKRTIGKGRVRPGKSRG
jgi:hypothetical protein